MNVSQNKGLLQNIPQKPRLKLRLNFDRQTIERYNSTTEALQRCCQPKRTENSSTVPNGSMSGERSPSMDTLLDIPLTTTRSVLVSRMVSEPGTNKISDMILPVESDQDVLVSRSTTKREQKQKPPASQTIQLDASKHAATQTTSFQQKVPEPYSNYRSASGPTILDLFADWAFIHSKEGSLGRTEDNMHCYLEHQDQYLADMRATHPKAPLDGLTRKCPLPAELYVPVNCSSPIHISSVPLATTASTDPQPTLRSGVLSTMTSAQSLGETGLRPKASVLSDTSAHCNDSGEPSETRETIYSHPF